MWNHGSSSLVPGVLGCRMPERTVCVQQCGACEDFQRVQQRTGSTRSRVSKCIFHGPSITQANHFSFVSDGTMLPPMGPVPMRGPESRAATVLNLGDSAPVGVPPPQPLHNPWEKGLAFRVRYASTGSGSHSHSISSGPEVSASAGPRVGGQDKHEVTLHT